MISKLCVILKCLKILMLALLGLVMISTAILFDLHKISVVAEIPQTNRYNAEFHDVKIIETDSLGVHQYLGADLNEIGEIGSKYHVYFSNCKEQYLISSRFGAYFEGLDWERLVVMPCTRLNGTVKVGKIDGWILY